MPSHLPTLRQAALQLYRLAILVAIAWLVRAHATRVRIEGNEPITIAELSEIYPGATTLTADSSERRGFWVRDEHGKDLGYVIRTMPESEKVIGYRGWSDTLVAFDPALHVIGVRIHQSQDTRDHVGDVQDEFRKNFKKRGYFLSQWNGKPWDEVAKTTSAQLGRIEGVSGASRTSEAIADGIVRRLAASNSALAKEPPPLRLGWREAGVLVITAVGLVLAFTGTHGKRWLRRGFQLLVILYIGFLSGDLLAQSIIVGWAQNGIPWRSAPGLVCLLGAALLIPWSTGKPLYCQHLCPHGAAQELLHGLAPKRWRLSLPRSFAAGLRWLPPLLLGVVLIVAILYLPLDLAHLEPFDAYVLSAAGVITGAIALAGLIASLFVPMAYCHYGCPTGALLNFLRAHGRADRFNRRDVAALLLLALAATLTWKYHPIHQWIVSTS